MCQKIYTVLKYCANINTRADPTMNLTRNKTVFTGKTFGSFCESCNNSPTFLGQWPASVEPNH